MTAIPSSTASGVLCGQISRHFWPQKAHPVIQLKRPREALRSALSAHLAQIGKKRQHTAPKLAPKPGPTLVPNQANRAPNGPQHGSQSGPQPLWEPGWVRLGVWGQFGCSSGSEVWVGFSVGFCRLWRSQRVARFSALLTASTHPTVWFKILPEVAGATLGTMLGAFGVLGPVWVQFWVGSLGRFFGWFLPMLAK